MCPISSALIRASIAVQGPLVAYIRDIFILKNYTYLENLLTHDELLKATCLKRCALSFFLET